MNKKISLFAGLAFLCYSLGSADDMKVKLNSTDGSTSFQVRNSNDIVVSTITSTGDAVFNSANLGGDLRVQGNDIFFGASQTERKIYDDPVNFVIGLSTNFYVAGRIHIAGSFRLGTNASAGYVLTTDANGVGTWQASAVGGSFTLPIDAKGDGNVITSTGDVSVQVDTDNNESKAFVVKDSAANDIFAAIERDSVPGSGELHLGNYARRFYDDPVNYVIGFSSSLYVNGRIHSASFRLGTSATAGYVLTTDVTGVGTWQAAPGAGGGISGSGTAGTVPRFVGSATLGDSSIDDDGTNATSTGRLTISGLPAGTSASQGPLYINPASASADQTLLGLAVGGAERLRFSKEGNLFIYSQIFPGSTAGGTQTARYLADDPGNYVLKVSTNLYIDGRVHSTSFRLGTSATVGQVLTTDVNGIGTWQAAPGGWTDGGAIIYPVSASDDVAIGGTDATAKFFFDTSASSMSVAGLASIGGDVRSAGNIFAGGGKQLTFGLQSSDTSIDHNSASYRIDITTNVKVGGYLTLGGDEIRDSGGASRITLATSLATATVIKSTVTVQSVLIVEGDSTLKGSVQVGSRSSNPATPGLGMMYYNTSSKRMKLYDASGWVDIATGTITGAGGGGGITDRSVESRHLLVTSTAIYSTVDIALYTSNTWTDIPLVYSVLSVDAQPSMIFANFSCSNYHDWNNNSTFFRILIDGTEVASTEAKRYNAGDVNTEVFPIALAGGLRVTSTGNKVIKVQVKSATDASHYGHTFNNSMTAFTVGSQ